MDISFTAEDEAVREEIRRFLDGTVPDDLKNVSLRALSREDHLRWHRLCAEQGGWSAPAWPKAHGGPGWTPAQRYIWQEETAAAETPMVMPFGVNMVAPVIMAFGNDAQKERFLPRILRGDDWWCQGYSEPGAGSDLASLTTKAERDGGDYVVNGAKTWTTYAQHADWIFCLVRTDPRAEKRQEGISFLLIDMTTPGVSVRPIITIDGGHEVNEVHFDNVRVPADNLVGEENKGWTYAKFLLAHERAGIAAVARSKKALARIKEIAKAEMAGGAPLSEDWAFMEKVAQTEIDLLALEYTELRTLAREEAGKGPGPESSVLKIRGSEIQQRLTELTLEAAGAYGFARAPAEGMPTNRSVPGPDYAEHAAQTYFNMRKVSIYGGSNEIQRNIIAKMILGV